MFFVSFISLFSLLRKYFRYSRLCVALQTRFIAACNRKNCDATWTEACEQQSKGNCEHIILPHRGVSRAIQKNYRLKLRLPPPSPMPAFPVSLRIKCKEEGLLIGHESRLPTVVTFAHSVISLNVIPIACAPTVLADHPAFGNHVTFSQTPTGRAEN